LDTDYNAGLFRVCLNWKVGGLLTFENAIDVAGGTPELIDIIRTVGDQPTCDDVVALIVDRGQPVLRCQGDDQIAIKDGPGASSHDQPAIWTTCEGCEGALDFAGIVQVHGAHVDCNGGDTD